MQRNSFFTVADVTFTRRKRKEIDTAGHRFRQADTRVFLNTQACFESASQSRHCVMQVRIPPPCHAVWRSATCQARETAAPDDSERHLLCVAAQVSANRN